jgi:hypothetical protein
VFESSNCPYDVILGRDFLHSIGLDIQFSSNSVKWLDTIIDMKHISVFDHKSQSQKVQDIGIQADDREAMIAWSQYQQDMLFDELEYKMERDFDVMQSFSTEISGRKYEAVSTEEVIREQEHLTEEQRSKLNSGLDKHTVLFDGKLGCYTGNKVHLKLIDNYKPSWKRAYPIPFTKEKVFKEELDAMIEEGTLE